MVYKENCSTCPSYSSVFGSSTNRIGLKRLVFALVAICQMLSFNGHCQSTLKQGTLYESVSRNLSEVAVQPLVHVNPFYTEVDELSPLTTIFDILVDRKGCTWFATTLGIRKYNGYNFIDFGIQNGLSDPVVIHLYEDYKGRVWSVSLYGEVVCYENGTPTLYKYNDVASSFLKNDQITSFYMDSSETLHLGTYTQGYLQVDSSGQLTRIITPESSHEGIGVMMLHDTVPFFFQTPCETKDQVTLYSSNFNKEREFHLCGDAGCEKAYSKTIRLLQLRDGSLLLSKENVLAKLGIDGSIERFHYSGNVISILEDSNGSIWIGVDGQQVLFYPQGIHKATEPLHYFSGRKVSVMSEDKQLGIWIGTFHSSAYYIPVSFVSYFKIRDLFFHTKEPGDFICSQTFTEDNFQLLSRKGNLMYSDGNYAHSVDLKSVITPEKNSFYALSSWNKDHFLVAGQNHLYSIKNKEITDISTNFIDTISRHSDCIFNSPGDSSIWFNSGFRIVQLQNGRLHFASDTIGDRIFTMVKSTDGTLWLGGENGLWQYRNDVLSYLGAEDSLLRSPIYRMVEFGSSLWIHSRNHDLIRKGFTEKAVIFEQNGRTFPHAAAFFPQADQLYFVSNYYLNKVSLIPHSDSFHAQSIRLSKKFSAKSGDGSLGMWRGKLTYISSADVHQFHFIPSFNRSVKYPFHIEQVKVNNQDTTLTDEYHLKHNENHVSIGFTMVTNSEARSTLYKYRIKDIDPEWIETNDRNVQYTSLPTGTHVFEVFARPKLGTWTAKPITVSFTIAPPYWETWWFISLCIIAGIGLIWAAVSYRYRRLQTESALQMALNESQQQALSARMNPHFIFNALNSIKTFVLENDTIKSNDYIARFSKLMRQILDQSQYTLVSLEEELKALDNYVGLELMRGHKQFSYSCEVDQAIDQQKALVPSLLLQPFVENAIWHGVMPLKRKGHISVSLQLHNDEIMCRIEDDGVGRANREKDVEMHGPAATQISNKRLDLINQRFGTNLRVQIEDLQDEQGHVLGTRVTIPVPIAFQ